MMSPYWTLWCVALTLAIMSSADAAKQFPPDCAAQTAPLGASRGRYPQNGEGAPVYRLLDHPDSLEGGLQDDLVNFNKTKGLGPLIGLLRSPFATPPGDRYRSVIVGTVNGDGGITPPATPTPTTVTGGHGRRLEDEYEDDGRNLRTNERDLNIFLPDTRQEVNIFAYPYRVVGKWRGCTASLVLDSGIIVTNAHCLNYLPDGSMDPAMWTQTFYAGFKNGNFLASSQPKAIWYNKGDDYAVLKLWSSLDATLGRLGVWWRDTSFFNTDRTLYMISYSGDFCTSWSKCRSKLSNGKSRGTTFLSNEVKHDLDATRGSSGSAMWNWYGNVPVMDALNHAENRNGGDVSLTLPSYTGGNPNYCKPAGQWKVGYDHVKYY